MGFRVFFWLAAACVVIGVIMARVPACQPKDVSDCTYDLDKTEYICPEDK